MGGCKRPPPPTSVDSAPDHHEFPAEDVLADAVDTNTLTVHNVLASAALTGEKRLDLDRCSQVLGNVCYNPAEFPALRIDIRIRQRSACFSVSLFESGRIQSTGCCYPIEAKRAMLKISRRINARCGYKTKLASFEIQNILAVFDTGLPLSLTRFTTVYRGPADYEPERFPVVRVRIPIESTAHNGAESRETTSDSAASEGALTEEAKSQNKIRRMMLGDDVDDDVTDDNDDGGKRFYNPSGSDVVGSYMISKKSFRKTSTAKSKAKGSKKEAVHANVFSTGKVTFTGAKSIESLQFALSELTGYMALAAQVPPAYQSHVMGNPPCTLLPALQAANQ